MKATKFRWVIIALVFFITVVNYIDRSAIAFAMPILGKRFHLDEEDIGFTLGAFNIGYALMVFIGGLLVDRLGSRRVWLVAALIWSLSIVSTAAATGLVMLFVVRLMLGVAEGPNFPALNRVVGDWLPGDERAVALGNALVAVPIALMIGGPIVSNLAAAFGWRGMFIILGVLGIIWVPVWYFVYRDFPEHAKQVNDKELKHIRGTDEISRNLSDAAIRKGSNISQPGMWRFLLTNPTLMSNNWAFFVFGYNLFFFMNWLPTFLNQSYQLNVKEVGIFTILPWLLASVLLYSVGILSDRIWKVTGKLRLARSYPIWISQLLGAVFLMPLLFFHSINLAAVFISLCVGFNMSANSAFYAINVDMIKKRSGTALGIMDFFFAIAGLVASTLTGIIIQITGSFFGAFVLVIGLNLSSVLGVLLFHHPDRPFNIGSRVVRAQG
jgi:ACS family hexuronate transporter-like MFS transporter